MLPSGHIAAGYLTAFALLKLTRCNFNPHQVNQLIFLGMVLSFAPDLDMFVAFAKVKKFIIKENETDHRKYISHAPIVWLIAGLTVFLISANPFWKIFGLLVWFCSWGHFFLDSLQYGVMWLWPFSDRLFAFKDREKKLTQSSAGRQNFFNYWFNFVWLYITKAKFSFFIETGLVVAALFILLKLKL